MGRGPELRGGRPCRFAVSPAQRNWRRRGRNLTSRPGPPELARGQRWGWRRPLDLCLPFPGGSRRRPPTCQCQGHSDSFPFHPGKPPPCPHPHPGLWGPEEEAWSPQGQAPAHTPGWPGPWDFRGHVSLGEERRHVALQPTLGPGPGWRLPFLGTCCGLVWTLPGPRGSPPPWEPGFCGEAGVLEAAGVRRGGAAP